MHEIKVLIIGSGKRVQASTLPVLDQLKGRFRLHKIISKDDLTLNCQGREYKTEDPKSLRAEDVAAVDLINLAVPKPVVPGVLKRLGSFDLSGADLLVETPVLLFKHFAHEKLLERFRKAWVSEDCAYLPCFDPVLSHGEQTCGDLEEVLFHRSAYKYHGLAALKALMQCSTITRATRWKTGQGQVRRTLYFANKKKGFVIEPRDYGKGYMAFKGSLGTVTDQAPLPKGAKALEPVIKGNAWTGFRVGDCITSLTP
ncbi:MAG: hypothetical protein KJ645_06210, partial [Planctomycetes bacterium]|nr:hypothetical protein [Planctomycetota bacterium]